MSKLALLGGKPVRTKLFSAYNTIGAQEKKAVAKVLDSGVLSQYVGAWHADFLGGKTVKAFEKNWAKQFGCAHAVSVNSNTSGLIAAMGAIGVGPGDEVIVSPYSMTISASAPMFYGAVPVFADIDEDIFCMSAQSIRERITSRTKAIIIVHIFGHPADMDEIMAVAREHKLAVIEDCAQVPLARYKGKSVGLFGDLGIFSLNYHKHIHTGEGGVVVTNNAQLAERIQLIRNHAEAVVDGKGVKDFDLPLGYNFRMNEVEAAIGIEQLKKLPALITARIKNADYLTRKLRQFPGITPPLVREGCRHVYYMYAIKVNKERAGVHRNTLFQALKAELPTAKLRETAPIIGCGYVKPLYYQSLYHSSGKRYPYNYPQYEGKAFYGPGTCPVAERMHFEEVITNEYIRPSMTKKDLDDVVAAFEKVFENINELKTYEQKRQKENNRGNARHGRDTSAYAGVVRTA